MSEEEKRAATVDLAWALKLGGVAVLPAGWLLRHDADSGAVVFDEAGVRRLTDIDHATCDRIMVTPQPMSEKCSGCGEPAVPRVRNADTYPRCQRCLDELNLAENVLRQAGIDMSRVIVLPRDCALIRDPKPSSGSSWIDGFWTQT